MSNKNVKLHSNADRNKPEVHKKYVPQYQVMGIDFEEYKSATVIDEKLEKQTEISNPRVRLPNIRQPYAKIVPSPLGRGKGPVPNVGNNMEHTWSSVDAEEEDVENPIDGNHAMIDNNEFVTNKALNILDDESLDDQEVKSILTDQEINEVSKSGNLNVILPLVNDDQYILLINNIVVNIGSLDQIQEETRSLVFGEHALCNGSPILIKNIIILKKIKLKVGVFLE